jgi:hypothetical protein
VVAAAPVRAAPEPRRAVAEDDLLGASRSRKPEPETSRLPAQLDEADILGELRKHKGDVRDCIGKQKASGSDLEGTMTVKMVVQRDGTPTKIAVAPEEFKGSVVAKCITAAVGRWKFPAFSGPSMPIDFPVRVQP